MFHRPPRSRFAGHCTRECDVVDLLAFPIPTEVALVATDALLVAAQIAAIAFEVLGVLPGPGLVAFRLVFLEVCLVIRQIAPVAPHIALIGTDVASILSNVPAILRIVLACKGRKGGQENRHECKRDTFHVAASCSYRTGGSAARLKLR